MNGVGFISRGATAAGAWLLLGGALGCGFAPPVLGPKVPVSFRVSEPGPHKVSVLGPGRTEQACELPCSMEVPSGAAVVAGSGAHSWSLGAVIPNEPSTVDIKIGRSRTRRLVGLIIGGVGTAGATASVSAGATAGSPDALMAGGITGVVFGVIGIVGLIVGFTAEGDSIRIAAGLDGAKLPVGTAAPPPPTNTPSAPAPGVCRTRFDCTGGKVCTLGMCVAPACVADADCPQGKACSIDGICEGPAPKAPACRTRLDCKGGLVCRRSECAKPACVADDECGAGKFCSLDGACEPVKR